MKKTIRILTILLGVTLFTCAQKKEIQIETQHLSLQDIKGNVKFVSVRNYEAIPNDTTGKMDYYQSRFGNRDVYFNNSGKPVKDVFHLNRDSSTTSYRYEDDKLINEISPTLIKNYTYNDEKKQIQIDFVEAIGYGYNNNAGDIFVTIVETYDENKNLIRSESKKENQIDSESKYIYDDANNLIMKSNIKFGVGYMDDNGVFQPSKDTVKYEYDNHNRLTKVLERNKITTQYFYDANGNLSDTWEFVDSGRYYVESKFLESVRWIKRGRNDSSINGLLGPSNIDIPEYLKYKGFFPMKYSFKYEFDTKRNWITRYRSINGEVDMITERKIHYR